MVNKKAREDKSKFVRLERKMVEEVSHFLFALGNQFINVKNAEGAFECFKYSIDLNDKHQPSVYNLGALYNVLGNFESAYRMFSEASRMKPNDLISRIAMAEVARKLNRLDESLKLLEQAFKEDPDSYMVMAAMAILHYDLGHLAEAMRWNDMALLKQPKDLHMLLNRALVHMTYGHWVDWWGQYEFCLSYQKNERMHNLKMSDSWQGNEMEGQSILVISDQGYGDAIQFSRYLAEAKELGKFGKLTYLVQPDLVEVIRRVGGIDEVVGFGERMALHFDTFSSLLGIMRILGVSPQNCWRPPHIVSDPAMDELWRYRVSQGWDGTSKKVGIVWAGDPRHGNDHARSLTLAQFVKATAQVDGVQLFSFQVGKAALQLESFPFEGLRPVVDLAQDFRDFDDTASAIRQMDLVISCDTSTPHLAACQGVEAWILLALPSEWRWLTDLPTAYWYSNTKLFRQTTPKDWDPVLRSVTGNLQEFVK